MSRPGRRPEAGAQRIFVGDVQGCAEELAELVERARKVFSDGFSLWVTGDLVNRGPGSRRALEIVRELVEAGRGELVLGNHELHALAVGRGLRDLGPNDTLEGLLSAPDAGEWLDWLRARPLAVGGEIAGQPFAMVHAAAAPEWSLDELLRRAERVSARLSASSASARAFLDAAARPGSSRDDLGRMTRCRSILRDGVWSSAEPESPKLAWHRAWSARGHDYGIVYGHWARQGLHVAPGLRGLDTGCVHHGRGRDGFLTAWLPGDRDDRSGLRPFDVPDERFWQVPARRRYYDPR